MTRLAERARRHQPRAGLPGLRRSRVREGRRDRGDPRGPRAVCPHVGDSRVAPRARREVPPRPGTRLRSRHGDRRHVRSDRGHLRGDPGRLRSGRRGRPLRAVLRLLQGERPHGRRRAARRDAARARLDVRPVRARRRVFPADPRDPAQHASQSDRQGLLGGRARDDRGSLPRARCPLHHRRGLRAPRVRGTARFDGVASRHARADDHDLVLREDVLVDRLEDRLGLRGAGARGRRALRPPVHHVRHGDAAAARRRGGPGGRPGVLRRPARGLSRSARLPRRGADAASVSTSRRRAGRTSCWPTSVRSASTTTGPSRCT